MNQKKHTDIQQEHFNTPWIRRKWVIFILLATFLAAIFIAANFIGSDKIIQTIGTTNGYIIAFIVSFFAGFSALTVFSFYSVLITLVTAGLDPTALTLICGSSLALGDMFMFYFGRKGRDIFYGRLDRLFIRVSGYLMVEKRKKFIPLFAYVYLGFIPLPNDWMLLFLASIKYPPRWMNLVIFAGDLSHAAILVVLTTQGMLFLDS